MIRRGRGQIIDIIRKAHGWSEYRAGQVFTIMVSGIGEDALGSYGDAWLIDHASICDKILEDCEGL